MVPENGFEVFRRVFVDFEGISLRRKFLNGLEPENIHMMIGMTQAFINGKTVLSFVCFLVLGYKMILLMVSSNLFFFPWLGSMTIDCLGILNDLSDCEDKLFPIGYQ